MSGAGTPLLTETARALGQVEALEVELGGSMRPNAVHHPGKAVCDLAVMLAAGRAWAPCRLLGSADGCMPVGSTLEGDPSQTPCFHGGAPS